MNKKKLLVLFTCFLLLSIFLVIIFYNKKSNTTEEENYNRSIEPVELRNTPLENKSKENENININRETESQSEKELPLEGVSKRITKKDFGDFISPNNSPIKGERFYGYHTGVDLEIFAQELNSEVQIRAICEGELIEKKIYSGYGGLVVQKCKLDKRSVTVVYGHMDLDSIDLNVGEIIKKGDRLGNLGENKSSETDFERKHLHLGIHRGASVDIRGYVQNEGELSKWIDPCLYICDE
jgi:murein DD-endopeptidase MepM/ murein hydrolase activator NlpD